MVVQVKPTTSFVHVITLDTYETGNVSVRKRTHTMVMSTRDKIKVVHLALSMLGVPVFIHLSYIKLYDNHVNSFLILLVVLVLILDINNIVKELLN
jgi:hypothetical protein